MKTSAKIHKQNVDQQMIWYRTIENRIKPLSDLSALLDDKVATLKEVVSSWSLPDCPSLSSRFNSELSDDFMIRYSISRVSY